MIHKSSIVVVLIAFLFSSFNPLYAGSLFSILPAPGTSVQISPAFKPVMLQGIKIDPKNPLHLDFIIDTGDALFNDQTARAETLKLVRYFLASLTVPNDQLWVNLSPYEKNRIIPDGLALTEMGSELLTQDYMLKQLTASLIGPEQSAGKQFWSQIYAKANAKYGSTQVPLDIFNKVWIVPDKATIYEHKGIAVIKESHLKVMLEQDYLSLQKHLQIRDSSINRQEAQNNGSMANALIRKIVLPQIEREVNEGRNFAGVRQVNNALILAAWFKQNLKQSLLGQKYANRNKVSGIDLQDRSVKQKIYAQYLKAFKKGVYNYIKEDTDPQTQAVVARKYFLGGYNATALSLDDEEVSPAQIFESIGGLGSRAMMANIDLAMLTGKTVEAQEAAQVRLSEIKDDYTKFPVVRQDKDIPAGVMYALAFYDQKLGVGNSPLRALIRAGKLRAGPDLTGAIKSISNEDEVIISTDSETEVDQVLVPLLTPDLVQEFNQWKRANNGERIRSLAIHTWGVIAKPMEVFKRYGILDLLGTGKPVKMKDIIEHVRHLKVDGRKIKFNTPNAQYIFAVLRTFESLGWLTSQGESASNEREFTLTAQGLEAVQFADYYTQVANFMPKFSRIADYLFNRGKLPRVIKGAATLRQLADLSKQQWHIADAIVIENTLKRIFANGRDIFNWLKENDYFSIEDGVVGNAKRLNNTKIANLEKQFPLHYKRILPVLQLGEIIRGQLNGYLVINLAIALWQENVFDLFNDDMEISIDDIVLEKKIVGNTDELKAAFDIFVNVRFLSYKQGKYKLTHQGLMTFDKVLNYGVPVSYRPSYDLIEQFLFGDAKNIKRLDRRGRELLVYRDLNVLGSGASHATYFKQIDYIFQTMIKERLKTGEIPPPEQLTPERPFVLSVADTGSGDGAYLTHVYRVIMKTAYGKLMRDYPQLYKIDMVGIDYNPVAQRQTRLRLQREEIPHSVMFGDISDPEQIVSDVQNTLLKKYGQNVQLMVIHTRTFLDHNRPWVGVKDVEAAKGRVSYSTGTYGWRGEAIPNNFVEQNLYEHDAAWYNALRRVGQRDLINIELHTIPPAVAAMSLGRTLTGPYDLSHELSDQFTIENSIYQARAKEAGFVGISHKLIPDMPLTTVSIDHWGIPAMNQVMVIKTKPAVVVDPAMSPFGGINLNPDLGFVRVERDTHGDELPQEIGALANINIQGIEPVLLKLVPLNSQQLLDE